MSTVSVNGQYLSDIADSIRRKKKTSSSYTTEQMINAIEGISSDLWAWTHNDGNTYLHLEIDSKFQLTQHLTVKMIGTIYWGDNSSDTVNYSSATTITHTYSSIGNYEIKLVTSSGTTTIGGGALATSCLNPNDYPMPSEALKKVELGKNLSLANYAFSAHQGLKLLYIRAVEPDPTAADGGGSLTLSNSSFLNCYALRYIKALHSIRIGNVNSIQNARNLEIIFCAYPISQAAGGVARNLNKLKYNGQAGWTQDGNTSSNWFAGAPLREFRLINGGSTTTLYNTYFTGNNGCDKIYIPNSITNIVASALTANFRELHLASTTPPSLGSNTALTPTAGYSTIYVPKGYLATYKGTTNWSAFADYMQEEPD